MEWLNKAAEESVLNYVKACKNVYKKTREAKKTYILDEMDELNTLFQDIKNINHINYSNKY